MTAKDITLALCQSRYFKHLCLPRYAPKGWFEADVFEVTQAGYFREYEIKISRADFKADAKKVASLSYYAKKHGLSPALKHDQLRAGCPQGPVQFWYVTPPGLVALNEVPEFAGLIEVTDYGSARGYMHEREVKEAPRLHKEKLDPKVIRHARECGYWRMHKTMLQNWALARAQVRNTQLLRAFGWPKVKPQKVEK